MINPLLFNNYSTNEMRVGTWINKKPLYRKTINGGALPNNTTKRIEIASSGGSTRKIVDVNPRIVTKADASFANYALSLPYYNFSNNRYINYSYSEWVVNISSNFDVSEFDVVVDVYYWKTTD